MSPLAPPLPPPCLPLALQYIAGLGFPTALFHFTDVLCLEDWALEMVAQPVRAVMLLFPIKAKVVAVCVCVCHLGMCSPCDHLTLYV